jgi:hypothetical protein
MMDKKKNFEANVDVHTCQNSNEDGSAKRPTGYRTSQAMPCINIDMQKTNEKRTWKGQEAQPSRPAVTFAYHHARFCFGGVFSPEHPPPRPLSASW